MGEGSHERSYEKMGSHLVEIDGKRGVHFAVWAPNARQVYLMGDFNSWNGESHPLSSSSSGIWTLFVPQLGENTVYKYRVVSQSGESFEKADPYGFAMELRPKTASVVTDLDRYQWSDDDWMNRRVEQQNLGRPISIYEVHLSSWQKVPDDKWGSRYLTYRELAEELIPYVVKMGFTHIELLPIAEHPFDASWGYQVLGFYAPTSRFGTPEDLMYFIDQCHQHQLGVILDWVPAHFPKDGAGLNFFDGTHLYAHTDPRQGEHQDWGTMIFNYGRHEVRAFLISNALFWLDKYHFDGLRVDAVASMLYLDYSREEGQWLPNQYGGRENLDAISFLQKMNEVVHGVFPGVLTMAEESTAWPMVSRPTYTGGLGFSLKWNMGWMHDTLGYMSKDPIHRKYHQNDMTFGLLYAFTENFILPLSHDEVVHGKGTLLTRMAGDEWQKFANLRAYYGFMWAHPGKKLLFMGGEFGQWQEWNFNESMEWAALEAPNHQGVQRSVQDLNRLYQNESALYENDFAESGFEWIDASDTDNNVLSFIRKAESSSEFLIIVSNFTPVPWDAYRIGVPKHGNYKEIFNSDSEHYWGSNVGNQGGQATESIPMHGHQQSLSLILPPLATIMLKLEI
jgi:1,4-alpha-glucan branching enzyme